MIGIIQSLISRRGINRVVTTNASCLSNEFGKIENPVIYGDSGYFSSLCRYPGEWWQVNILFGYVYIDSYRIKSYHNDENSAHLKSWILEGSSDEGRNFQIINSVPDNDYLNGMFKEKYFPLKSKIGPFNSFRLSTKNTHHDGFNYCVRINEFDVYGSFILRSYNNKKSIIILQLVYISLLIPLQCII